MDRTASAFLKSILNALAFFGVLTHGTLFAMQVRVAGPGGFEQTVAFQPQEAVGPLRVPAGSISLLLDPGKETQKAPKRFRCKMEGVDESWRNGDGLMRLLVVFFDENHAWVSQKEICFNGESPGWNGTANTAPLQECSETVQVPQNASTFVVVLTSAGPPTTVGTLAIGTLSVSRGGNGAGSGLPLLDLKIPEEGAPAGWARSGELPNMAHITRGTSGALLALTDDNPEGHAEWRSPTLSTSPKEQLRIQWSHCHSIGTTNWGGPLKYYNLEPGRYSFRIEEVSYTGQLTQNGQSLTVLVLPPFWQRGWFLICSGLALGLVVAGLLRFRWWRRTRLEIARLREQNVVEAERARIARDIHDDLGSALSGISMLSQFLDLESTSREEAIENLRRINRATQKMSRAMDEIVWALNPRNDQLDRLVTFFGSYAQEFLASANIEFRCIYPEQIPECQVDAAKRHHLFLAFKEALTNAVKHAQCRTVEVDVDVSQHDLVLSIGDDGIGFPVAQPAAQPAAQPVGQGNGLLNMQQRMKDLSGTCSVVTQPGKGTRIIFQIPLH